MEQQLQQLTYGKAVMVGAVLAVLYFFIMYNDGSVLEKNIGNTKTEIQNKETELQKIKTAVADAERYQNTKRALGAELESVLKAIPAQLTSQDLMRIVSNEAKALGINLTINPNPNFRPQVEAGQKPPFFEPVIASLSLEGTYNQLMSFLSAITKVDKIITLSALTMVNPNNRSTEETGPINLKLTAEMRAYRYLPQSAKDEAKGGN